MATIHDDSTASALGFQRGTIEGPTHFSQLTPGLLAAWGPAFFEAGRISVHYRSPAYEDDRLRAEVAPGEDGAATVSVCKQDGSTILTGTADVHHALTRTEVAKRLAAHREPQSRSVLDRVHVGDISAAETVRIDFDRAPGPAYPFTLSEKLAAITEPSPWYEPDGSSPWGKPVLPFEMISVLLQYTSDSAFDVRPHAVGLFLDQEIDVVRGPVHPEQDYRLEREVLAFSSSSRTESYWVRSALTDAHSGELVATGTIHVGFLA